MGLLYQYTTDEGPTPSIWNGSWLTLAEFRLEANTENQYQRVKVQINGDVGDTWNSNQVDDYQADMTPPSIPTIGALQVVGTSPNLGFFSDWTEPTEGDFAYLDGQLNIDDGGYENIDNTADLGGATTMYFNESLAGTQTQAAGWLYQNHYARNGYTDGQTAQIRFRSYDDVGNNSAYSTSAKLTMTNTAEEIAAPSITRIVGSDATLTVSVTAADESKKVYAIYKLTNKSAAWSDENITFSRTGSGDIDVTGLSNGTDYQVMTYHKDLSNTCVGRPSNVVSGYPDADPEGSYRHARKLTQRDYTASMLLQVAKNQGELMVFRNEGFGTAGITVYGVVASEYTRNVGIRGGFVDGQEIIVSVPRQTSFPPDNFDINSTIEVDGNQFQVQDYTTNPNTSAYAAEFVLTCSSIRGQEGY